MKRTLVFGRRKATQKPMDKKEVEPQKPEHPVVEVSAVIGDVEVKKSQPKNDLVVELENVLKRTERPELIPPEKLVSVMDSFKPVKAEAPAPAPTPVSTPTVSLCEKDSLSSEDVMEILGDNKLDEKAVIECKRIPHNKILSKETARFRVTTEKDAEISGFMYTIQSEKNFIHTSHIENVEKNKVSMIINNLSNKDVEFNISYVAIF